MRFMVIVKVKPEDDRDLGPSDEAAMLEMGRFNDELVKAGVMRAAEGLLPSSKGVRLAYGEKGQKPKLTDGPFSESKEVIGGFWILELESREACVAWMERAPFKPGDQVEIRPVAEMQDLVDAGIGADSDVVKKEAELRRATEAQKKA